MKKTNTNFQSIWEYEVQEKYLADFTQAYDSLGLWVELFSRCDGYIKTELIQDIRQSNRFISIDYWQSFSAYLAMKQTIDDEYAELDNECENYTKSEQHIGYFNGST